MRDQKLLDSAYENDYGIDLEAIHSEMNEPSEYHTKNGRPLSLNDLNLDKSPIGFSSSKDELFRLTCINERNFLYSQSSCYPCSRVYQSGYEDMWLEALIIPKGEELFIENRRNSVRYSFLTLSLFEQLKSKKELIEFDSIYRKTFGNNEWFTDSIRIQFLVRSNAPPEDIYNAFIELSLFNPFQLSVFAVLKGLPLQFEDIISSLVRNNTIPTAVPYITPSSFKANISDSSSEIIKTSEFEKFLSGLTQNEINNFFELDFIQESIKSENLYPEFELDFLDIKIIERWQKSDSAGGVSNLLKYRFDCLNINEELVKEYYRRLNSNLRSIENKIRSKKGFNVVGSLYSESLLYKLISEEFSDYTIISQYSPEWLGNQRIDIFIKELNLAIEYQGRQHYEPVDYFGGKEGFKSTLVRDKRKRLKCKRNNVLLLEVKYDEDFDEVVDKIKKLAVQQ